MKYNFCIIGVAGYVAPRHLHAIKNLKHNLLLSFDTSDSVGILDKYFPKSLFFNKFKKFESEFLKIKKKIHYTVITTPNHTHFKYIKFALKNGSNVICEKPLVITRYQLIQLKKIENKYKKKIYSILQLRTLKELKSLKKKINKDIFYNIEINYITPRGQWYQSSWKGDKKKSGGILFNIGVHLIDVLVYLFGKPKTKKLIYSYKNCSKGEIKFSNAMAKFYLSTKKEDLKKFKNKKVVRDFIINDKKIDLVKNFEQSHIDCYRDILEKKKYSLEEVKESIKLILEINK